MSHTFCRILLKDLMRDVRKHTTTEQRKSAWVYNCGSRNKPHWEFHGPNEFYFTTTKADCAYSARFEGWMSWIRQNLPDVWEQMDKEQENNHVI